MGESQRQAIVNLIAKDDTFESEIAHASSVADAVRFARHYRIEATAEDFALLDDLLSELELAAIFSEVSSPTISRSNICF